MNYNCRKRCVRVSIRVIRLTDSLTLSLEPRAASATTSDSQCKYKYHLSNRLHDRPVEVRVPVLRGLGGGCGNKAGLTATFRPHQLLFIINISTGIGISKYRICGKSLTVCVCFNEMFKSFSGINKIAIFQFHNLMPDYAVDEF